MGIAYLAAIWVLIEVANTLVPIIGAPPWILRALVFSAALGFPLALVLAWVYEWTPEGIRTTSELEGSGPVRFLGRKLDFAIIGLLVLAVGVLLVRSPLEDQAAVLPNSVAVLPFDNLSPDTNDAYFATGIHDEILNQLAKLSALNVIARTSVLRYADERPSIQQIANELNVEAVMEGSIRYADNRVRITAQLIDSGTGTHLWSDTYEREFDDIFAIESDIAINIANALEATFSPAEAASVDLVPTENTRAYDFYLSGLDYFNRSDDDLTTLAVQQFQRAVDEDATFALAWAALARAHLIMYLQGRDRSDERLAMARQAVDTALALAPEAGESHLAMAAYHANGEQDYPAALAELAIAEQRMPGKPEVYETLSYIQRRANEWTSAVANMARAIELDPRNIDFLERQAENYLRIRNYEQAEQYYDRIIDLAPDNGPSHFMKAFIPIARNGDITTAKAMAADYSFLGWNAAFYEREYDLARRYIEEDFGESDTFDVQHGYYTRASEFGVLYALAGQTELALSQFEGVRAQIEEALNAAPDDARLHVAMGEVLVGLGQSDAAVRAALDAIDLMPRPVDALLAEHIQYDAIIRVLGPAGDVDAVVKQLDDYLTQNGMWSIEGLLPDPRLDPIRDDARFQALVEKYRRR